MQGSIALFAVLAAFRVFPAAILASHGSVFLDVISYIHIAWLRQNLVAAIPLAFKRSSGLAIAKNRFRNGEKKEKREAFAFLARNSEDKEYSKRFTQLTETKVHKESACLLAIEFPRFTSESSKACRPMGKTLQR